MTGATLFSGIGAPEVAMPEVDWRWCAEIEPFPSAVHHARFGTPNLGDVTAEDFIERALALAPLDLLVGGSPCQSFSVAGLRQSLDDRRGNLTLRYVEIADALNPTVVIWENVPGVLSTRDNAFGCFLGSLVGAHSPLVPARGQRWTDAGLVAGPKRTAAWRVLDAQHFGLAQRRKRVFVVASAGGGPHPAEVLFEQKGVRRDSEASRAERQDGAGTLSARTQGGGGQVAVIFQEAQTGVREYDTAGSLRANGPGHDPVGSRVREDMAVRRLTPRECERLQGFPDDFTLVEYRKKPAADGPRYKALGNSMAVPCLRWIGQRLSGSPITGAPAPSASSDP